MKKNNKGFTLIELLISSLIIILLSTFSISVFFDRQAKQLLQEEINEVKKDIIISQKELGKKITDFEFGFYIGSDFYTKNTDKLYKDKYLYISGGIQPYSNFGSGFNIDLTTQNTKFLLNILKQDKILTKDFIGDNGTFDFFITENSNYLFNANTNGYIANTIQIIPFSNFDKKNDIKLNNILDDKNNYYSGIMLSQNLLNDIQFQTLTGNLIKTDKISLEFNANNETFTLEITK